jgi:rubrerythrin
VPLDSPPHAQAARPADTTAQRLRIRDRNDLHEALQSALALEHATIPPYLYALFSLKPGQNQDVAGIIRSVVMQEMLHMALVGNILNSMGATPRIGAPGFVPHYPGPLPGGVLPGLTVSLRRCSIEHVRDVFMAIEQPETPLDGPSKRTLSLLESRPITLSPHGEILETDLDLLDGPRRFFQQAVYDEHTIGWFYKTIACAIVELDASGKLFTGDPARQVVWPDAPGRLYRVTDARTALWAIFEIIRQGEGTPTDPTTGPLPAAAPHRTSTAPSPEATA